MEQSSPVEHMSVDPEQSDQTPVVSLSTKVALVVFSSIAVLIGAVLFVVWVLSSQADDTESFRHIIMQQFLIGNITVHGYTLLTILIAVLVGSAEFFALRSLSVQPLQSLLAWLTQARRTSFTKLPLLPPLARDEVGALGRAMSSSVAYFLETKQQNTVLHDEKSLFINIAGHQLRTPLTGLLWGIELLLAPTTSAEDRERVMGDVDGMLKRMRLIINHLLATADVEEGRFGYVLVPTDVLPLLQKLIADFKPVSDDRGITLTLVSSPEIFPVYADAVRLELALFNMLTNAIDYTPRGGTVTVSVVPHATRLEISIEDTGIGISDAEYPSLFSKFYRGERGRRMHPDGSGLGLFLAKHIIANHGSDITVTTKENVGSRFAFLLDAQKR
jgi:signal transduction histidine kinase